MKERGVLTAEHGRLFDFFVQSQNSPIAGYLQVLPFRALPKLHLQKYTFYLPSLTWPLLKSL